MRFPVVIVGSVLLSVSSARANAQQRELLPGARARVSLTDAPRAEGTVTFVSRDSIVVATSPSVRSTIRTRNVTRIEQFAGHSHAAGAVRGAAWMSLAGAVLVGASKPRSREEVCPAGSRPSCRPLTHFQMAVGGALVFGMLGEWIGGIVGRDQWRHATVLDPPPMAPMQAGRVTLPVLDPGIRIRVTALGVVTDGLEGTVIQSTPDTLTVATPAGVRFGIPTAAITEVKRPVVKTSAGALAGAGWGAAVYGPMAPFMAVGTDGASYVGMTAYFTAVGSGLGALIGAAKGKETWEPIRR